MPSRILLLTDVFPHARDVLARLLPDDQVEDGNIEHLLERVRHADVLIPMMTRLDGSLLGSTSARLIQQWGVGLEGVDVAAASSRGIPVCNVPSDVTPNADVTAEHAVFLMMILARRLRDCDRALRAGRWGTPIGQSLHGSSALIVGLGRVGRALARRLVALGMHVEAVRRNPDADDGGALGLARIGSPAELPAMASSADFVVSAASVNDDSRGLIGRAVFERMKPTAFLVNVSRGPIVDEAALIDALRGRRIGGAGLDVLVDEPVGQSNPLLQLENVVITPHVAGVTTLSYEAIGRVVAENVALVKAGRRPRHCVNPAVLSSVVDG